MIFVQLGCGENHLAAERILAVVVREGFPLPAGLELGRNEDFEL
jgi:hypothetical protein